MKSSHTLVCSIVANGGDKPGMGGQASEAIGRSVALVVQSSGWQDLTCDYGIALAAS